MTTIAFIGLGHMGAPMAMNLLKAGFSLQVFDLSPSAMDQLAKAGALACDSVATVVAGAEVIISMVPASAQVEALYLRADGILAHANAGALLMDCSTIAPATAQAVAKQAAERGLSLLDAPVSGGTAGAAAGTLTFIVGGPAEVLARAMPYLQAMGKNIFHAGAAGAGQVAKICNNMLLGILMLGTAEAINLGVENGLDAKVLSDIMSKSSGRNWALELYNPYVGVMENVPAARGYVGGFGSDLMLKDLGLALEAALAAKVPTPLGTLTRNLYDIHSKSGQGGLDFSSIIQLLQSHSLH